MRPETTTENTKPPGYGLTIRCEEPPIGIAVVSATGGMPRANATFLKLAGISVDQVDAMTVDLASVSQLFDASPDAAADLPYGYGAQFISQQGKPVASYLVRLPASPSSGAEFLLLAGSEPSAQHRLTSCFSADNQQFRYFIEHLPAGVVVHDSDGAVIDANALASSLLSLTFSELIGKSAYDSFWKFLLEDGTHMRQEDFPAIKSLARKQNLRGVVVGVCNEASGGTAWLLCNTLLVEDDLGNITHVIVSFTDCTELKTVQQALKTSEERLNLILLGTNDAPWDWNLETNEIYYSDKWWSMIGRAPGELPADHDLWHRLLHPDDVQKVAAAFDPARESGSTYEVEFRLRHKDGHYVPVLSRGFVLRDKSGKAVRVSGTNSDLSERKRSEQRIYNLAYFDQLTGLPNRRHLLEQLHRVLSRTVRTGQTGAVLFLDLDNFKDLNDTLGHDTGDLMLRQFAHRLQHSIREVDQLARLGGDEFVVVVEDLDVSPILAAEEAEAIACKLLEAASPKFDLHNKGYSISTSVGIALFDRRSTSVEAILKQADLAMYGAKAAGRGVVRFFDPEMQRAVDARSELEIALREAVARNEFELYCQPQFDAAKRLSGGEMLLRWRHPQKGLIGPAVFIPTAEACGLMVPIGAWVLREACRAIASWSDDPVLGALTFSINVSAQQLHNRDFVQHTLDVLTRMDVKPHRVCLELTESLLAQDVHQATEKMCALRSHGINFSIDDFGTGYSSLSYLHRFPLYALKIDRSFVSDDSAGAIIEVIVSLASKLQLKGVAEGVESATQFELLKEKGCEFFQGYFLGMPVPLATFVGQYGAS